MPKQDWRAGALLLFLPGYSTTEMRAAGMRLAVFVAFCCTLAQPVFSATDEPRFVAVIAVVSKYDEKGTLRSFNFAGVGDRVETALRAFAKGRGYTENRISISNLDGSRADNEPTHERIKETLYAAGEFLNGTDTLVFHFLGHGATDENVFHLLTSGARSANEAVRVITSADIDKIIAKSRAGLRLAFVDACQIPASIAAGNLPAVNAASAATLKAMAEKNRQGLAIFLSTQPNRPAWIDDEKGRHIGFFTRRVIEAFMSLGAGGRTYTVADLQDYLATQVPLDVRKRFPREPEQIPQFYVSAKSGRITLIGAAPTASGGIPVRKAFAVRMARQRGMPVTEEVLQVRDIAEASLDADTIPDQYPEFVRGSCFARNVSANDILRWQDLGALGLCEK